MDIEKSYENATILLTGSTGTLGKLILEKILYSLKNVKKIYVLIRPKKSESSHTRLQNFFNKPEFSRIANNDPKAFEKVVCIDSDLSKPKLGVSPGDTELLKEVNVVIHCAATIRFNEPLEVAVKLNLRGTKDLLDLSRQMKNLKAFVHVSTAYSKCHLPLIDETCFDNNIDALKLIEITETLDSEYLKTITPGLLGGLPNTYNFTKQITENLIDKYYNDLPICIVRPSIVSGSVEEPLPGFVDNIFAINGVLLGILLGFIRVIFASPSSVIDITPSDYIANNILAAGWKTMCSDHKGNNNDHVLIYNLVSSTSNPLTLGETRRILLMIRGIINSRRCIWYPYTFMASNKRVYDILNFILHKMPLYVADFALLCTGRKQWLIKAYKSKSDLLNLLNFFMERVFTFTDDNNRELWNSLSEKDKNVFCFDYGSIEWEPYIKTYIIGGKKYLLRESLSPEALARDLKHYKLIATLHHTSNIIWIALFAYLFNSSIIFILGLIAYLFYL